MDMGTSAHMSNDSSLLDRPIQYADNGLVIVEYGASLPITHFGTLSPPSNMYLLYVLVVPHLKKNLFSIIKLTSNFHLSVTFTNNYFIVQNH